MKKILVVLCLGLVVGCGTKSEKVDNENDKLIWSKTTVDGVVIEENRF